VNGGGSEIGEALSKPHVISLVMTSNTVPVRRESASLSNLELGSLVALLLLLLLLLLAGRFRDMALSCPRSLTPEGIILEFSARRAVRNFRRNTSGSDGGYLLRCALIFPDRSRPRALVDRQLARINLYAFQNALRERFRYRELCQ
jgi:hypothetical protein